MSEDGKGKTFVQKVLFADARKGKKEEKKGERKVDVLICLSIGYIWRPVQ